MPIKRRTPYLWTAGYLATIGLSGFHFLNLGGLNSYAFYGSAQRINPALIEAGLKGDGQAAQAPAADK